MNPHPRLCVTCVHYQPYYDSGTCLRQWHNLELGHLDRRCPLPAWHAIQQYCGPQLQGWEGQPAPTPEAPPATPGEKRP